MQVLASPYRAPCPFPQRQGHVRPSVFYELNPDLKVDLVTLSYLIWRLVCFSSSLAVFSPRKSYINKF